LLEADPANLKSTVPDSFLIGEDTDITHNWGTVHAAIRSGLRVFQQMLKEGAAT
jgi:hypothetical protein